MESGSTMQKPMKRSWRQAESYDQKVDIRVSKRECLRERFNSTTCRSGGKERNTDWKNEQQSKRQREFLRRRQIDHGVSNGEEEKPRVPKVVLRSNVCRPALLNRRSLVMSQELGITWPDLKTIEQALPTGTASCLSVPPQDEPLKEERVAPKRERGVQTEVEGLVSSQYLQRESSTQTESGVVTASETAILELSDYLQEALHREAALKQKLSILQHIASTLLLSSEKLWTVQYNEDLMKCKIVSLESQLQVCMQTYSRDGVKKKMLKMEEQKLKYEEKAKAMMQKSILDKQAVEEKVQSLEDALRAAQQEAEHWRGLYEDMKESCAALRWSHEQNTDQLHVLQSKLERAGGQEAALRSQLDTMQQNEEDLLSRIAVLQEDNQLKRDQLDNLREKLKSSEDQKSTASHVQTTSSGIWNSNPQSSHLGRVGTNECALEEVEHQLQETQHKLKTKEKECVELRLELEAVEHEYQSCQSKLKQCREELKLLQGRKRPRRCSTWLCLSLLVVMVAVLVATFHPPIYEHLAALYSVLRTHADQFFRRFSSLEWGNSDGPQSPLS
uniref:TRAF3 interacting protein 3 n=1 Tax=Lepisosteus oculatus TaxID=7918 RepID=W5MZR2_LEPOC|nr:PREDICTED: TRAF3-interacting JNK-activating modulator isoform X1 [Lepisosteus oculatus]XP_015198281.1 PREDICTED: TRAF3-interacting JNK-activating modulator isoform X1 [Lepisosteus oculatus]